MVGYLENEKSIMVKGISKLYGITETKKVLPIKWKHWDLNPDLRVSSMFHRSSHSS